MRTTFAADLARALVVAATVAALGLAGALGATADSHDRAPDVATSRVDGADRIDTAARLAERTVPSRAETVTATVARADDFPDALAAATLAGAVDGPVLLTWPDALPARTREALDEVGADRVMVLGGHDAVSADVEAALADGHDVQRLTGADRWATAAAVARAAAARSGVGEIDGQATALLVSGESFPDALAAGPLAVHGGHPVLLVGADHVPAATRDALADLGVERALLLGGPAAVGDDVAAEVAARGVDVERIAGGDRTATAAAVADAAVDRFGLADSEVRLARGDAFADALTAGVHAGARGVPLLLTVEPDRLGGPTGQWLAARCGEVERLAVAGGVDAVDSGTVHTALAAADGCIVDPERTLTYETGTRGDVAADVGAFRARVAAALNDPRGWALDGELAFVEVDHGGDLRVWLASPQAVDAAHAGCSADWSCRVGDDVYLNDHNWREATATYRDAGRSRRDYRHYVVNHEVGHVLGHDDYAIECDDAADAAPVMNQQSIALRGCATNVWPLPWERDEVRARWLE